MKLTLEPKIYIIPKQHTDKTGSKLNTAFQKLYVTSIDQLSWMHTSKNNLFEKVEFEH